MKYPNTVRLLVATTVSTLVLLGAPLLLAGALPAARADTSAVTVTGAGPAWNELTGQPMADLPTATVSQTTNLVDQTVQVSWTNFSPSTNDAFNATVPATGIWYDVQNTVYPVWVLECRGTNPPNDLSSEPSTCAREQAGSTQGSSGLGNSVKTVTTPNGAGTASFHVETAQSNTALGCDATHDCSIVVLPAFGGEQNPNYPTDCADHSLDYPTEDNGYDTNTDPASDAAFGGTCSWANRLVIPLHFAATPTSCPAAAPTFAAAGSPMLARAMEQWQAGWCRGTAPLSFDYNSTSNESQARSSFLSGGGALTSSTDVALTSLPADPDQGTRKFTYAPVANTAIAIAFVIDDPTTGAVIPELTLNARLVAKLLTQSYAPYQFGCLVADTPKQSATCDPAVRGNPQSIFTDPEFLALNPQVKPADFSSQYLSTGQFFPNVVSGDSDLVWTLTSWIAADPNARAFLQGHDDGYGMHVNTYYRDVTYPTAQLDALDPGFTDPAAPGSGTMQNAWQPLTGLDNVGALTVGNTSNSLYVDCTSLGSGVPCTTKKTVEPYGARAIFAILDQGQAAAYNFPVAHLINAAGDAIAPSTASLSASLSTMRTNADGVTQRMDFTSQNKANYPLTTVDYAMLPTCGLSATAATGVTNFLTKIAQSQTYGVQPGTIAPGYLALTDPQRAALTKATTVDAGRPCTSAPASPAPATSSSALAADTTAPAAPSVAGRPQAGSAPAGGGPGAAGGSAPPSAAPIASGAAVAVPTTAAPTAPISQAAFGTKGSDGSEPLRLALPLLLILGALLLIGGPGTYLAVTTGAASTAGSWLARLIGRRH